ncbi:RHS repeat domain-containing protein [Candidatus Binatus sp.]|jgi:YD repeat-containing protein|uniref:RHS repeat domain-containing protein n=1 Tax=Candidatus Binatus sp. TaxID=2811406 RepID=UPI003C8AB84F
MASVSHVRRSALVASAFVLTLLLLAISLVLADVTYQYDKDGRVTEVCNGSGRGVTYGYDPDGNISSVVPTSCPTPTATATP